MIFQQFHQSTPSGCNTMNAKLKNSSQSENIIYNDFLLKLEEHPTPETIKKLQIKIDELEDKLLDQARLSQCKELELRRQFDEQKGRILMKYLELKAQYSNFKNFYQEKRTLWEKDNSNLLKVIRSLVKAITHKEEGMLDILKDLDRDLNWGITTSFQSSYTQNTLKENCFLPFSEKKNIEEPVNIKTGFFSGLKEVTRGLHNDHNGRVFFISSL